MKGKNIKTIVGIILIALLANALSAASNMVAVSDTFFLETDKMFYAHGEWVCITFTNRGDETVYFKQMPPWIISGPPGIVAPGILMFCIPELPPGESFSWGWGQLNELVYPPYLVPAGTYTVFVEVYGSMAPWTLIANISTSFEIVGPEIHIDTNSTMTYFNYEPSLEEIASNITGPSGTRGYFNITIPTQLLNGSLIVLFDDVPMDYASKVNSTHTFARLTYTHSTHNIKIVATILGDVNGNKFVNYQDLFTLAKAYGSTPEKPNWNVMADVDHDQDVDYLDLFKLASNYGKSA